MNPFSFQELPPSSFRRTPWKNGLGWTDQIAISPEGADLRRGDFDWRLSTARIEQSADFSPFPQHDRVLVILEGQGVELAHRYEEGEAPDTVDLPPGEPYEFPGDVPTRCELKGGPVQDLSVFLRKGAAQAIVDRVTVRGAGEDAYAWEPQGGTAFIFVRSGTIEVEGHRMDEGGALRLQWDARQEPGEPVLITSMDGEAQVILINLAAG